MGEVIQGEGLLRRWARRKQDAKAAPAALQAPTPQPPAPQPPVPGAAACELPPDLPDMDTLDAASDYAAFLHAGVPAAVQRLALQKAWVSDAAISDFRGMAEYAWDFNAPEYGRLWAVDDVAKLVQAVIAPLPEPTLPEPTLPGPPLPEPGPDTPAEPAVMEASARAVVDGLAAKKPDVGTGDQDTEPVRPLPRRHGGAMPC